MKNINIFKNLFTITIIFILFIQIQSNPNFIKKNKSEDELNFPVIGIDLGTDYISAGFYNNGKIELIPNDFGNYKTPAVVSFLKDGGEPIVGEQAVRAAKLNPDLTVYEAKRLLGAKFDDLLFEEDSQYYFTKFYNSNNNPQIIKTRKSIYIKDGETEKINIDSIKKPEQVVGYLLKYMKDIAEKYLNVKITDAVISIPAYYNNDQRIATKNAGFYAGFEFTRLFSDASCIALSQIYDEKSSIEQKKVSFTKYTEPDSEQLIDKNYLIFDYGAGTVDAAVVSYRNSTFRVEEFVGNTHQGGSELDREIYNGLLQKFEILNQNKDNTKIQFNLKTVEIPKIKKYFNNIDNEIYQFQIINGEISRNEFNSMIKNEVEKAVWNLESTLIKSKNNVEKYDTLFIAGGSSNLLLVQEQILDLIKREDIQIGQINYLQNLQPQTQGASIMGQQLYEQSLKKQEIKQKEIEQQQRRQQKIDEYQKQKQQKQENQQINLEKEQPKMLGQAEL